MRSDRSLVKLDSLASRMDTVEEKRRGQALLKVGPRMRETGLAVSAEDRELLRRSRSHFIKRSSGGECGSRVCREVGSRCWQRNDRKTKGEPRTRLGVNLIFYSAGRSWCASTSTFEHSSTRPRSGRMCECRRAEAPRHLGCETGDMPWKNPMDPLLDPPPLPCPALLVHPLLSLALLTDRKNSPRISGFKARAIKSSSSWYATRVCKSRKSRLQVHRGDVTVSTAGI